MVYSLIFWVLAAICNSVMDTLVHHYSTSVFKKLNSAVWNPEVSWKSAAYLPYTKYKIDAWHLFKSAMIIFLALSIISAWIFGPPLLNVWWFYLITFVWLGVVWNGVFNLFYNHILR
jgi:hypothetical protein